MTASAVRCATRARAQVASTFEQIIEGGQKDVLTEVDALITDEDGVIPPPDFGKKEILEEKEVGEILINWSNQRQMIDQKRKERGFPPAKVQKCRERIP